MLDEMKLSCLQLLISLKEHEKTGTAIATSISRLRLHYDCLKNTKRSRCAEYELDTSALQVCYECNTGALRVDPEYECATIGLRVEDEPAAYVLMSGVRIRIEIE